MNICLLRHDRTIADQKCPAPEDRNMEKKNEKMVKTQTVKNQIQLVKV